MHLRSKNSDMEYKGVTYAPSELARLFGVKSSTFSAWKNRYGSEEAIKRGEMTPDERKEYGYKTRREGVTAKAERRELPMPEFDPYYELKNRAESWIKEYGLEGAMIKAGLRQW